MKVKQEIKQELENGFSHDELKVLEIILKRVIQVKVV